MEQIQKKAKPGNIILFGSGETAPTGRRVFHSLFKTLPSPIRAAVLETPAGFQPNSAWVARQVVDFLEKRLQNFELEATVIPARKHGTPFGPNNPEILAPLYLADVLYLGAGSPTYAVRQLKNSLAWEIVSARHIFGASLVLASAATLAVSAYTLPVYEIYKAGAELHWQEGLDLFGTFGLNLAIIPHWNNHEGGDNLDTSRCFMGGERFTQLLKLLPLTPSLTIVGIDEHTALIFDLNEANCTVAGNGGVTILRNDTSQKYSNGETFNASELGELEIPDAKDLLSGEVWQKFQHLKNSEMLSPSQPPSNVLKLVEKREIARAERNWDTADQLRVELQALGWTVRDAPEGPEIILIEK